MIAVLAGCAGPVDMLIGAQTSVAEAAQTPESVNAAPADYRLSNCISLARQLPSMENRYRTTTGFQQTVFGWHVSSIKQVQREKKCAEVLATTPPPSATGTGRAPWYGYCVWDKRQPESAQKAYLSTVIAFKDAGGGAEFETTGFRALLKNSKGEMEPLGGCQAKATREAAEAERASIAKFYRTNRSHQELVDVTWPQPAASNPAVAPAALPTVSPPVRRSSGRDPS